MDQKGSLVTEDKLRFDFSHTKPVDVAELRKIEEICNQMIQKSCVVHFRDVALDRAKAITGLRISVWTCAARYLPTRDRASSQVYLSIYIYYQHLLAIFIH